MRLCVFNNTSTKITFKMLTQEESLLEKTLHLKDIIMQETTDESDETLSLSDLPLYSVEVEQQDFSARSRGSTSISSSEQDFFEFCSQELGPPLPPESIIFCGKLIPHKKQQDTSEEGSSKLIETKDQPMIIKKKCGCGFLRWVFCLSKDHDKSKSTTTLLHKKQSAKNMYNSSKHGKGYEMSILASSSSGKARWYNLILFGVSRFTCEVELKDMKNRLSRRQCSLPPPTTLKDNGGLTGLIRVLSCSNSHPNTMVMASTSFSRRS